MPKQVQTAKNTVKLNAELPHSNEVENAILGCILFDNDVQNEILLDISDDDFYSNANRTIFIAMKEIIKSNIMLDFITLTDYLEKEGKLEECGGIEHITEIAQVASTANYKKYKEILRRDGTLRKLIRGANSIIERSMDSDNASDSVSFAEKVVFDIAQTKSADNLVQAKDVVPQVLDKFDKISRDKTAFLGIRTGFTRLDRITNGLQNSDMIVIGARPSVGKTSFGMNIIENAAIMYGKKCAVFSLEMGREQIVQRMLCSIAEINMSDALRGDLDAKSWTRLEEARKHLSNTDISINDVALISPKEILSICRRIKRKRGLDLILIDYIGLLDNDDKKASNTRQNDVSEISRSLKALAKEMNVPVLVLAQLSRVAVTDTKKGGGQRRPQLSDLRESGSIEQDADIVMFIHRPDRDNSLTAEDKLKRNIKDNVAEILVEKHRNGNTGMFKLYFDAKCTKFRDYNEEEEEQNQQQEEQEENVKELQDVSEQQFNSPFDVDSPDDSVFGE